MKKLFFTIICSTTLLMSCQDGKQSYSTLQVYYPTYGYRILMADQQSDSIKFITTEAGYLTSSCSWLKIPKGRDTIISLHDGTIVDWRIPVIIEPNLTGVARKGAISVVAGSYIAGAYYAQVGCLGITRPTRYYDSSTLRDSIAILTDTATQYVDSIVFTVYDNWTLSVKDTSWLHCSDTIGSRGTISAKLALKENTSTESRRNEVYLHSAIGITDTIPVMQKGKKVNR